MFKIGSIVYVNNTYSIAEKCEIIKYTKEDGLNIYKVHSLDNYGTFGVLENNIFNTKEEAINAELNKFNKCVDKYVKEINTLEDLLKFPLNHCFMGEEYTEYSAIKAYRMKVKELTSIEL